MKRDKLLSWLPVLLLCVGAVGAIAASGYRAASTSTNIDRLEYFVQRLLPLGPSALAQLSSSEAVTNPRQATIPDIALPDDSQTYFATVAGGGAPGYNEIALEKNVRYFQRSLAELGFSPGIATLFFANGNDGQATVRYLDDNSQQQFKVPEINGLTGAATYANTKGWFQAVANAQKPCPSFFYFTGHGAYNSENADNNSMILWEEVLVSVKEMAGWLDELPADQPFVTMMAQCYSGSFANLIYEGGDPAQPVALHTRCGFFATVDWRPSVGCTPAVNEADYKDYSSSFFAGLTGRDRIGNPVESADYNQDGKVSYAEAHAFAKVDEETTDWPISTVESWLQRQVSEADIDDILAVPMEELNAIARPEEQHVIAGLATKLELDTSQSFMSAAQQAPEPETDSVEEAYFMRLQMELVNVGAEAQIRQIGDAAQTETLEKITKCEEGTWQ